MITNNAKKIFLAYGTKSSSGITGTNINGVMTGDYYDATATSGQYPGQALGAGAGMTYAYINTLSSGYGVLDVGFDDTPEAATDYRLADGNEQNPRLTFIGCGKNSYQTGDILNVYANFRNDGGTNVVVKEIGFYGNPFYRVRSDNYSNTCLLFRKVLENPVTIAPGETYTFAYNVKFRN